MTQEEIQLKMLAFLLIRKAEEHGDAEMRDKAVDIIGHKATILYKIQEGFELLETEVAYLKAKIDDTDENYLLNSKQK